MTDDTRITIRDAGFLTMSLIERCPRTMMIRELVMNAVEAASQAKGKGVVQFRETKVENQSGRKLSIRNDGPGMDAQALVDMCDLASSGKTLALDRNFGMGAKVAALCSNHAGLRYRSCRDGVVSQVTMGYDGHRYVIFTYGDHGDVIDVTEAARDAGDRLDADWTEVALCGMSSEQDTVAYPYGGSGTWIKQWVGTELIQRFDSLPENVSIRLSSEFHPRDGNRKFAPFHEKVATHGTVTVETDEATGIGVRYLYDDVRDDKDHRMSINGSVTTARIGGAVVFRGEIYEVCHGQKWGANAPAFGVTFGSKQLSVMVVLPDDTNVRPEQYRRFLNYSDGDKTQVFLDDFRDVVVRCMPDWFKDRIQRFRPASATGMDDLQRRLQDFMNERLCTSQARAREGGAERADEDDGTLPLFRGPQAKAERPAPEPRVRDERPVVTPSAKARAASATVPLVRIAPPGSRPARLPSTRGHFPRIHRLYDEAEVEERDISGKAGKYVPQSNDLFVNMNYPAYAEARDALMGEYAPTVASDETAHVMIREASELAITQAVGYAVAYALVKNGQKGWARDSIERATSPESLSIAADGWENGVADVKRGLAKRLGRAIPKVA